MVLDAEGLTDRLVRLGRIRRPELADAFRRVPREEFVPPVRRDDAYRDEPVTWRGESCASQPSMVARMLEQLDVQPGQRVLEVGAATGWNAALMATLVGPGGRVVTVELDAGMADVARDNLARLDVTNVLVETGDAGDLGDRALFHRAIWTCAAWETPDRVEEWLAPGGRLVVPLVLRGSLQKSVAFGLDGGRLVSDSVAGAQFVVQRGVGDRADRCVRSLGDGWSLWCDDVAAGPDETADWSMRRPAVLATSLRSDASALTSDAATWLAVRDARFCSLVGPHRRGEPSFLLPDGLRLPGSTGLGLCDAGGLALVALDGDSVVAVGFGAATALAAELVGELERWNGREVAERLSIEVAPRDADPGPGRVAIVKDRTALLVGGVV